MYSRLRPRSRRRDSCSSSSMTKRTGFDIKLSPPFSLLTSDKTTAQGTPPVAVARRQFIGFRRPFAAGRVAGEFRRLLIRPSLQDGSDQSPLIFDLVAPDEERLIALHHVQQERLVSGRQMRAERGPV